MKDKINKDPVGETLTEDIHNHFYAGYNLIWSDWHWCMVDYDIIHILKDYIGYFSWGDVPIKQRELCCKITTTSPICQSGIFNGRSFDHEFQKWKIMRIMECVCKALSGCSLDSCQCLH